MLLNYVIIVARCIVESLVEIDKFVDSSEISYPLCAIGCMMNSNFIQIYFRSMILYWCTFKFSIYQNNKRNVLAVNNCEENAFLW